MALRNQKTRFALRLPAKLQQQLLPLVEKEDPTTGRNFATIHKTLHGGDVEVPLTGAQLLILARVAGQHFEDVPQAHNLFNLIAGYVA
jgi:hypothetical protein